MTDEQIQAVRTVRVEANKLLVACMEAVGTDALLHVAFDLDIMPDLPIDHTVLLGRMRALQ